MERQDIFQGKVIFSGDFGVGKSSVIIRMESGEFDPETSVTVGFEYKALRRVVQSRNIELKVWDASGQEKYRNIVVGQFKNKQGVFLVFDLTNEESLRNSKFWLRHIKSHINDPKLVIVLLGNKSDLVEDIRVREEAISDFTNEYKCKYFEVSARKGTNVVQALNYMSEQLFENYATPLQKQGIEGDAQPCLNYACRLV